MEWRDIPGYEGHYQASDDGKIRSVTRLIGETNRRIQRRILKPAPNLQGRMKVILSKGGKTKGFQVHRLVYEAFKGRIPSGQNVYPVDGNPLNTSLGNLATRPKQPLEAS